MGICSSSPSTCRTPTQRCQPQNFSRVPILINNSLLFVLQAVCTVPLCNLHHIVKETMSRYLPGPEGYYLVYSGVISKPSLISISTVTCHHASLQNLPSSSTVPSVSLLHPGGIASCTAVDLAQQDLLMVGSCPLHSSPDDLSLSSFAFTMLGAAFGMAWMGLSTKAKMSGLFHTG